MCMPEASHPSTLQNQIDLFFDLRSWHADGDILVLVSRGSYAVACLYIMVLVHGCGW